MAFQFVVIGGGPAGVSAATHAARLGAEVILIERDVIGGAAHLWDCIPSKAMIATGGALSFLGRSEGMGLETVTPHIDTANLSERLSSIMSHSRSPTTNCFPAKTFASSRERAA